MRLVRWIPFLLAPACFSPEDVPLDGTDTEATSGPSTSSPMTTTTPTPTTTMAVDDSTSSGAMPPMDGSGTAAETTAGVDSSGSSTGSEESTDTGPQPACAGFAGRVVYVNMSGAELTMGVVDNAPANITSEDSMVGVWPGYTTADADDVYALVEAHWAPYDVCLTREPPASLDYTMIVVSSETFQDPNFVGFGVVDCGDAVQNSVNVVVLSEEAGIATTTKAIAISKHLAHTFGLNSVMNAPDDLMNQFVGMTLNGATFTSDCHPIVTQTCDASVDCGPGEQQSGPYLEIVLGGA